MGKQDHVLHRQRLWFGYLNLDLQPLTQMFSSLMIYLILLFILLTHTMNINASFSNYFITVEQGQYIETSNFIRSIFLIEFHCVYSILSEWCIDLTKHKRLCHFFVLKFDFYRCMMKITEFSVVGPFHGNVNLKFGHFWVFGDRLRTPGCYFLLTAIGTGSPRYPALYSGR